MGWREGRRKEKERAAPKKVRVETLEVPKNKPMEVRPEQPKAPKMPPAVPKKVRVGTPEEPKNKLVDVSIEQPEAPKKPPSAFFVFVHEKLSKISSDSPDVSPARISGMWKNLDAEEKRVYEEKAQELKVEYEKELAVFKNIARGRCSQSMDR